MLPCVCSVKDHRWRQNVVKTKKWHTSRRRVCHCCFYHILTSSVIYYWTDPRQHGIYLLNRPWKWRNMWRSAGSLIEKNKVYTGGVIFIKWRMILAQLWTQFMQLRKRSLKKNLQRDLNPWPGDTGAMLYKPTKLWSHFCWEQVNYIEDITRWREHMNFILRENKIHIFKPPCNVLFII